MPTRIITALLLCFATALALAESNPPEISENAPERHVVVPGDTLWGISGKFLKEPWRWWELWKQNRSEIENPHRIYPGQVVILDRSGPTPVLKLGQMVSQGTSAEAGAAALKLEPKIYEDRKTEPIPIIPPQTIQPFLSEPRIVEADTLDRAPRIFATEESRVMLGVGNVAYAVGIESKDKLWQAYRPAKPLKDPETGEILGFEAFYLGSLRVSRDADPVEPGPAVKAETGLSVINELVGTAAPPLQKTVTTLEVVSSKREMGVGDRLMPTARPDVVSYAPHAPTQALEGRIASLYDGVGEAGPQSIVTLNRGKAQGVEMGHVLAIYHRGKNIKAKDGEDAGTVYRLPDERVGLVLVFSVYERIAYALVMSAKRPVAVGDLVRKP